MELEQFEKLVKKITVKNIFNSIEKNGWLVGRTISRNIVGSKMWKELGEDQQFILVKKVDIIKREEKINPGIVGAEKCYFITKLHHESLI